MDFSMAYLKLKLLVAHRAWIPYTHI